MRVIPSAFIFQCLSFVLLLLQLEQICAGMDMGGGHGSNIMSDMGSMGNAPPVDVWGLTNLCKWGREYRTITPASNALADIPFAYNDVVRMAQRNPNASLAMGQTCTAPYRQGSQRDVAYDTFPIVVNGETYKEFTKIERAPLLLPNVSALFLGFYMPDTCCSTTASIKVPPFAPTCPHH